MQPLTVIDAAGNGAVFTVRIDRPAQVPKRLRQGGEVLVTNATGGRAVFTTRGRDAVVGPISGGRAHIYVNETIPPGLANALHAGVRTVLIPRPAVTGMGQPEKSVRLTTDQEVPAMQPPLRLQP